MKNLLNRQGDSIMNTNEPTVYINWYGRTLEGELLEGEHYGMRRVRISLSGHQPVALFTPDHIYPTLFEASAALDGSLTRPHTDIQMEHPCTPGETMQHPFVPVCLPRYEPKPSAGEFIKEVLSDAKNPCKVFLRLHWDHDRNRLQVSALEEFYRLWLIAHGASPTDNTTSATVPVVSVSVTSNPTKKQLRSTGAIQYRDTIQTSLFDLSKLL